MPVRLSACTPQSEPRGWRTRSNSRQPPTQPTNQHTTIQAPPPSSIIIIIPAAQQPRGPGHLRLSVWHGLFCMRVTATTPPRFCLQLTGARVARQASMHGAMDEIGRHGKLHPSRVTGYFKAVCHSSRSEVWAKRVAHRVTPRITHYTALIAQSTSHRAYHVSCITPAAEMGQPYSLITFPCLTLV